MAVETAKVRSREGPKSRITERIRAAVLFIDVCDSTAIFERFGEVAGRDKLRKTLAVARKAVESRDGRVMRVVGDALLAVFADAATLVAAASAAQVELERASGGPKAPDRMKLHCGGHLGNVVIDTSGEVFGEVANVASRVQDLAGPDQIYVTANLADDLPEGHRAATRRIGSFPLRGKRGEIDVYEILWKTDGTTEVRRGRPRAEETELVLRFGETSVVLAANGPPVTIGRWPGNDLLVDDGSVSRVHAEVSCRRGDWYVKDRSTNGTFLKPGRRRTTFLHREERALDGTGELHLGRADGPTITYAITRRS